MTKKIVDLIDAKAMKAMGRPLNTPIKTREFSAAYNEHWLELTQAYDKFIDMVVKYSNSTSPAQWQRLKRRFAKLRRVTITEPKLEDKDEQAVLLQFKHQRAGPFLDYWNGVIIAVENGAALTIRPDDIPLWFDEL